MANMDLGRIFGAVKKNRSAIIKLRGHVKREIGNILSVVSELDLKVSKMPEEILIKMARANQIETNIIKREIVSLKEEITRSQNNFAIIASGLDEELRKKLKYLIDNINKKL